MGKKPFVVSGVVAVFLAMTAGATPPPVPTPAPDLSQPIFQLNPTDYCKPDSHGDYQGELQSQKGSVESSPQRFDWGQGGGCVYRPLHDVWGVTHNQAVMVWGGTSSYTAQAIPLIPGTTHVYAVNYVVNDIITVKWLMNWYHALEQGTIAAPQRLHINYRKMSGTSYIQYWEGTIELQEVAPGVTAVAMRNQINATQQGPDDAVGAVSDVFGKLRTATPDLDPITLAP